MLNVSRWGLAGVLTVSKPVNVITDVVYGAFDNLLDEGRTQRVCFLTRVVVDTVLGFAVSDYAALVGGPLRPVCGLVHAVLEPVVGGVEAQSSDTSRRTQTAQSIPTACMSRSWLFSGSGPEQR